MGTAAPRMQSNVWSFSVLTENSGIRTNERGLRSGIRNVENQTTIISIESHHFN